MGLAGVASLSHACKIKPNKVVVAVLCRFLWLLFEAQTRRMTCEMLKTCEDHLVKRGRFVHKTQQNDKVDSKTDNPSAVHDHHDHKYAANSKHCKP